MADTAINWAGFSAIIKIRTRLRSLAGGSPDDLLGYRCPFLATEPMTAPTPEKFLDVVENKGFPRQSSSLVCH